MEGYRPSRLDRMLDAADRVIRRGFSFVIGADVPAFEEMHPERGTILGHYGERRGGARRDTTQPSHPPVRRLH
jgi:hypothetical protein